MPEEGVVLPVIIDQTDVTVPNTEPKMWYTSVEMWTSIIALVCFILQGIFGNIVIPADIQAAIVSLIMMVLRTFRKPRPIAWTKAHLEYLRSIV